MTRVAGQDFKLKEKVFSTTAISYYKSVQIQGFSLDLYVVLPKNCMGGKNLKVMARFSKLDFPSSYKRRLVKGYNKNTFYINNYTKLYLAISSFRSLYSIFLSSGRASGVLIGSFSFSDFGGALIFDACYNETQVSTNHTSLKYSYQEALTGGISALILSCSRLVRSLKPLLFCLMKH